MNARNGNVVWLDHLRALAIFSVIFLHVSAPLLTHFDEAGLRIWWVANVYDGLVRFCVPVFLMMSGALILPRHQGSISGFLAKRLSRVVLPFLFWATIYIALAIQSAYADNAAFTLHSAMQIPLQKLLHGPALHFWYVYLIIGLYLLFPLLGKWLRASTNTEILYFLCMWMVTTVAAFPAIQAYFPEIELIYFSGYIGYPVLGYYLMDRVPADRPRTRQIAIAMIITGIVVTIMGTYYLSWAHGSFDDWFYKYLSPNVIVASCGVFLLFKDRPLHANRTISFISKHSYGIYLCHMLFVWAIHAAGLTQYSIHPVFSIPLISILCLSISAPVVWLVGKLPYGKHYAG